MVDNLNVRLKLMGHFRCVVQNSVLTPATSGMKTCALLSYLAMETSVGGVRRVPRQDVIALLWPLSTDDQNARNNLSQMLHRLRRLLGDHTRTACQRILCADARSLWLNPEVSIQIDVTTLLRHIRNGDRQETELGLRLYRRKFLVDIRLDECPEFDRWQAAQEDFLWVRAMSAYGALTDICIDQGDWSAAVDHAERQLRLDRATEVAYRQLITIYALRGERELAINTFLRCVEILNEDLGVEPDAQT
ncbi:MAG: hypothetical protein KC547_23170, partial [Anaerolineae bacterium]|nr:hypothetical protein [Anaerolineae bacterium]